MKRIKGFTIIELLVAMAIFMIVVTIAIGAFVAISRTKSLSSTMKESQQKLRIALEMVTRLSRQAEKVIITETPTVKNLDLYFDLASAPSAARFQIENESLYYIECPSVVNKNCTDWAAGNKIDLFGGTIILSTASSSFQKIVNDLPPSLKIVLDGRIDAVSDNPYFEDQMKIETETILESLK